MGKIDSKTGRDRLKPRREPYWHKLQAGGYLGYRRTENGGSWIARYRLELDDGRHKQTYEALGDLPEFSPAEQFDEAARQAREWFRTLGTGAKAGYTVEDAVNDYVRHREVKNGPASAEDARLRLHKHAVPALGHIRLTKLTTRHLTDWRDSLVRVSDDAEDVRRSKDGANRLLSYLKAALNLAFRKDIIGTDKAWRRVQAFEGVGDARKVLLTDEQVARFFEKIEGQFADLCRSGLLTGARYGELAAARVRDLDTAGGVIRLDGKTGSRDCYLSDDALAHFKRLAKGKLPGAHLHVKPDGEPWGKSHQHRPMQQAAKAARLPSGTTFYALRHAHISRALLAGVNAQVVAENCGTSVRMIERHYGKFLRADRRAMFNRLQIKAG
jgi:integrase